MDVFSQVLQDQQSSRTSDSFNLWPSWARIHLKVCMTITKQIRALQQR